MASDELSLVIAAVAGDRSAFTALCERYTRPLVGLAYSLVGDIHAAQDIAQDGLLKAYRKLGDLQRPDRFGPWLRQIVANGARDHLRKLRPSVLLEETAATTEIPVFTEDDTERLLQRMPDGTREAMILHYVMGLTPAEAAKRLGITRSAFDTRLSRGRESLRSALDQALTAQQERIARYLEGFAARVQAALQQEPRERVVAAKELALLAARANMTRLEQDLKSPTTQVRLEAAQVIRSVGDRRFSNALCQALAVEEEPYIQAELCRALTQAGEPEQSLPTVRLILKRSANLDVIKAAQETERALQEQAVPLPADLPVGLGDLRTAGLEHLLLTMLVDGEPKVRASAAYGLARLESVKAVTHLIRLVGDEPAPFVRLRMVEALGALLGQRHLRISAGPYQKAVTALAERLSDEDRGVQAEAAWALAQVNYERKSGPGLRKVALDHFFAVLPSLLAKKPHAWWVTVPHMLAACGDEETVLRLLNLLREDPQSQHQGPLNEAIWRMAGPGMTRSVPLMQELTTKGVTLIAAVGKTQDRTAIPWIISALGPGSTMRNASASLWQRESQALSEFPDGAEHLCSVISAWAQEENTAALPLATLISVLEGCGDQASAAFLNKIAPSLPPRLRMAAQASARRICQK